jgi:hypothetical protein
MDFWSIIKTIITWQMAINLFAIIGVISSGVRIYEFLESHFIKRRRLKITIGLAGNGCGESFFDLTVLNEGNVAIEIVYFEVENTFGGKQTYISSNTNGLPKRLTPFERTIIFPQIPCTELGQFKNVILYDNQGQKYKAPKTEIEKVVNYSNKGILANNTALKKYLRYKKALFGKKKKKVNNK